MDAQQRVDSAGLTATKITWSKWKPQAVVMGGSDPIQAAQQSWATRPIANPDRTTRPIPKVDPLQVAKNSWASRGNDKNFLLISKLILIFLVSLNNSS